MESETILVVVVVVVGFVLSCTVHEWAHAWMATRLGDSTAESEGRLTLNPLSHIDPIGTLLFPAIGAAIGGMFFGWARPVPYNAARFHRGVTIRGGTARVALAGPFSNLVLALLCASIAKLMQWLINAEIGPTATWSALMLFVVYGILINIILMIFNLLPVPPLDGHRILAAVAKPGNAYVSFVERHHFVMFIVVLFVAFYLLRYPMSLMMNGVMKIFGLV